MTESNAAAARRWIAERLLWERFLEETTRTAHEPDAVAQPAAA